MSAPPPDRGTPDPDARGAEGARPADDEVVSAVLDGVATPDEEAAVAADPELRRRLDEFTEIRTALLRDPAGGAHLTGGASTGDELAHRRSTIRRVAGAVGVAAAATLLVVGLLASFRSTDPPDVVATGGRDEAIEPIPSTTAPATASADSALEEAPASTAPEVPGATIAEFQGTAAAPGPDCARAVQTPDGGWVVAGTVACGALQITSGTSNELASIIESLLVSNRSTLIEVGVGTGPAGTSCPSRDPLGSVPLGAVAVTDGTGPLALVLDESDRLFLLDASTCSPR